MSSMKRFKSIDKQTIKYFDEDRILFTVKNDMLREANTKERNFTDLYPQIEIDGEVWDVMGVESFQTHHCYEGMSIGIYVYPKKIQ